MYGDDDVEGYDKEVPKEFWHDQKRVDKWIADMKEKRKKRNEQQ